MAGGPDIKLIDRISALFDHLGLEKAILATQMPADLADFAKAMPDRISGLILCVPTRLDPAPFEAVADRLLLVSGSSGLTVETTARAAASYPVARRSVLADYAATGWSDVVAERTSEIVDLMSTFIAAQRASVSLRNVGGATLGGAGAHAGLTWKATGAGPVLLLFPFFLAPSQWTPAIDALSQRATVVVVGGPHVGGIAALEDRASAPTYRAMFCGLVDRMELTPGARVLDVGCGSGALDRMLATRLGEGARIHAVDINPFFLTEAGKLAAAAGVADRIRFGHGSATDLPFPDATFDGVFSATVLEECDADRAIAEMRRVTKPGGRVAIAVRAIDVPQWWSLDVPPALADRAARPPQSVGAGGCADKSLYPRMRRAGLVDVVPCPALITLDKPDGPIWRYREDYLLSLLTADEERAWRSARDAARDAGLLIHSHVLHAAVGRTP
jgi:SAM-dependent methyltransferase